MFFSTNSIISDGTDPLPVPGLSINNRPQKKLSRGDVPTLRQTENFASSQGLDKTLFHCCQVSPYLYSPWRKALLVEMSDVVGKKYCVAAGCISKERYFFLVLFEFPF